MIVRELAISGLMVIEPQKFTDERGWFARLMSETELRQSDISQRFVQMNLGYNFKKGTLRGLHFQYQPSSEGKLIRCTHGAVYDVAVDLRPESETYLKAEAVILEGVTSVYIPPRFAHGYQTLTDYSEVQYLLTEEWDANLESGLQFDDPRLQINWPLSVSRISKRDLSWGAIIDRQSELIERMIA